METPRATTAISQEPKAPAFQHCLAEHEDEVQAGYLWAQGGECDIYGR